MLFLFTLIRLFDDDKGLNLSLNYKEVRILNHIPYQYFYLILYFSSWPCKICTTIYIFIFFVNVRIFSFTQPFAIMDNYFHCYQNNEYKMKIIIQRSAVVRKVCIHFGDLFLGEFFVKIKRINQYFVTFDLIYIFTSKYIDIFHASNLIKRCSHTIYKIYTSLRLASYKNRNRLSL